MQSENCPECGQPIDAFDRKCQNPECGAFTDTTVGGIRIPTRGWGKTILLAIVLALVAALAAMIINSFLANKDSASPEPAGIEDKLVKLGQGDTEQEIILAEGSVEATPEKPPEPVPGGLTWAELTYPGADRVLNFMGRNLKDGERAYVTYEPYDDVKDFYFALIEEKFYKQPNVSEVALENEKSTVFINSTGSLTVKIAKRNINEKIYILITSLENLSEGALKQFGGQADEKGSAREK
jgi:hypothetical protein